ncbi:MAG TPA: PIG-L family deacetylase, partial [Verrucomicrobiae bacterium]|nr:PIG-L family deacetylase [Verrucomicrobiae bacterium]
MTPYHQFVAETARLLAEGQKFPLGGFAPLPKPVLATDAPRVLIFSPHPDDEVLIGALPLRLLREAKMRVLNVAVTQGSNKARQSARLEELRACCDYIGFELITTREGGLENINPRGRADGAAWKLAADRIADILREQQPRAIIFPHVTDRNSSHIGTHYLVMDALATLPASFDTYAVESEFWGAMDTPNLMVESSPGDLGDLMAALSFHVGEVLRNPYHLRTPGWM